MSETGSRLKYRSSWLFIGYVLVIFIIYSSLTSHTIEVGIRYFDKYAHTFAYFGLMGWFVQIYQTKKTVLLCATFFVCMGVGLEFVQGMTAYRSFDLYDMLANALGVLIALGLSFTRFTVALSYFENLIVRLIKK